MRVAPPKPPVAISAELLAAMLREACLAELRALKPGNVSAHHMSYTPADAAMNVKDFVLSAEAIARCVAASAEMNVGESVLSAITATRSAVNANTNLGIVLLSLPAIIARKTMHDVESMQDALHRVLHALTQADAQKVYEAIRLAEPGGMGCVTSQDISRAPTVTLRQAMALAADRDAIARAYVNDYAVIFEVGLPALQEAEGSPLATTYLYLSLLAAQKDSLITRKFGDLCATEVAMQAREWRVRCKHALRDAPEAIAAFEQELSLWDKALKLKGHNPGTTADFTVASLLMHAMQQQLDGESAAASDAGTMGAVEK